MGSTPRRSRTAQYVAQLRAVLNEKRIIDDPFAMPMLTTSMRAMTIALRAPVARRLTDSPFVASLAARIAFFDEQVVAALDHEIDQVVILGAGYDSRTWRFGRPAVQFFEVDQPATQADKRSRAPAGGPVYVPADLNHDSLRDALAAGGFEWVRPALFVIEGVTMYLRADDVRALLTQLAADAAGGSRLAVNFAASPSSGTGTDKVRQRTLRLAGRMGGEAHHFFLDGAAAAASFVAGCGWTVDQAVTLRDVARRLLGTTTLRIDRINQAAPAVAARLDGA